MKLKIKSIKVCFVLKEGCLVAICSVRKCVLAIEGTLLEPYKEEGFT